MFNQITNYLEKSNIAFSTVVEDAAAAFTIDSKKNSWDCMIMHLEESKVLCVYSCLEKAIPEHRLAEAALYANQINLNLLKGSFEIDIEDGTIAFRTYTDLSATALTENILDRTIVSNITIMERYLPEFQKICTPSSPFISIEQVAKKAS